MSLEKYFPVRVRPDNNVGRVANHKRMLESDDALTTLYDDKEDLGPTSAEALFQEKYGIPLLDAMELSKIDGQRGEHWRNILENLNNPQDTP